MAGKNDVRKEAGVTEQAVTDVFDAVLTLVKNGEDVRIIGFGTFSKKHREERNGRNPATGEELVIPAKDVLHFKPSKDVTFAPAKKAAASKAAPAKKAAPAAAPARRRR